MEKITHKNAGFTLTEIIIVIIILSLMLSFIVPKYALVIEKTKVAEAVQILKAIRDAQSLYKQQADTYTIFLDELEVDVSGASRYFDAPPDISMATNGAIPEIIGKLTRGGLQPSGTYVYDLEIDENGVITCTNASAIANLCAKLGF